MGIDFDDSITLHDGKRTVYIGHSDGLPSLCWHFDRITEEYIGTFVWNRSESLGFDEEGNATCFCKEVKRED